MQSFLDHMANCRTVKAYKNLRNNSQAADFKLLKQNSKANLKLW